MSLIAYSLRLIGPVPKWAKAARTGRVVRGIGGDWLPQSLEIATGCYVACLTPFDPGGFPACIREPIWTCPDVALAAAEKAARVMAR